MEAAVNFLKCKMEDKSFKYLEIMVGINPRRIAPWEPLLHKIKKRLASWKGRLLSFVGRLTLLKSVLGSLAMFTLSLEDTKKSGQGNNKDSKQFFMGRFEGAEMYSLGEMGYGMIVGGEGWIGIEKNIRVQLSSTLQMEMEDNR